jgi:hypothetical protein
MLLALAVSAPAALNIMPLRDVRAGMHATGRTIFSGATVETFQAEILGVLDNIGPKQSLILARLSGGPLEHTGVMQGMSGSPIYIDGKLIGAVALAFPGAKDPIAGIRPIEEMLAVDSFPTAAPRPSSPPLDLAALLPAPPRNEPASAAFGDLRLTEVANPISFSGFTSHTIDQFAPRLREFGMEPRQGISLGGAANLPMGDPSRLEPGSMITVQLMSGDMSAGADGTLTAIDGNRMYAFGHRFMALGNSSLPFARSEVLTLLANINTSFKISESKELMGVISQDRSTAITGTLGDRAGLIPLDISVREAGGRPTSYHANIVNDRFLSPFLLQMATFSAIDASERGTGPLTVGIKGVVEFENRPAAADIGGVYTGEGAVAQQAAVSTAIPLSYIMQGGFDSLRVKRIALDIDASNGKRSLDIANVFVSRREAKPGDTIELTTLLAGDNGREVTRTVRYTIPTGTDAGILNFTVADGPQTSLAELRQLVTTTPASPDQLLANVNRLRSADKAYVRVWRQDLTWEVHGEELTDPPPSVALVLTAAQSFNKNANSKLAELTISGGPDMLVTGSKNVQVEVKP